MPKSNLVEALRFHKDDSVVLYWLTWTPWDLPPGYISQLAEIELPEAERMIRKGSPAMRLALTYHPSAYIREMALGWIREPDGKALISGLTPSKSLAFRLISHRSGFIREAALHSFGLGESGSLERFVRLSGDWVAPIAELAEARAIATLPTAEDQELFHALPLIYGLTMRTRVDRSRLVRRFVDEANARPGLAKKLRRHFQNGKIGLWTYRNIGGRLEIPAEIAREGLNNPNLSIKIEAARKLAVDPSTWSELIASSSSEIRRMALDIAPPEGREEALLDRHAGVRNDARFLLGEREYAAFYRSHLPALGAISGLGELGNRADAARLEPFLIDENPETRRRALEAYVRLMGDDAANELLVALQDPSGRVKKAAVAGLLRIVVGIDADQILDFKLNKASTWKLLTRCARWSALLVVLRRFDEFPGGDPWLAHWAVELRSRPYPPAAGQAAQAVALLESRRDRFNEPTFRDLRSILDTWVGR